MHYNPVAQNWRARFERLSTSSRSSEETPSLDDILSASSFGKNRNEICYKITPRRHKGRKRRGILSKKRQEPCCKPPWNDSTVVVPVPKRSKSHQVWGTCTKREPFNSCPPQCAKKSQSERNNCVNTVDICAGRLQRKNPTVSATNEWNKSNNQNLRLYGNKRRLNRGVSFPNILPATSGYQRKKVVAFDPHPVTCRQVYDPDRDWQRGRTKIKKFNNGRKAKAPSRSIIKIPNPASFTPECCPTDFQAFEKAHRYSSVPCRYTKASDSKPRYIEDTSPRKPVTKKISKSRLTTLESRAFEFLAKRLLEKSPPQIPPRMNKAFSARNATNGCGYYLEAPPPKQRHCPCAGNDAKAWTIPTCMQFRRRSRSAPPKKKSPNASLPRSSSLVNSKCRKRLKKKTLKSPCPAIDDYTRAMSRMHIRENELLEKYSPTKSDSDLACYTGCSTYHTFNAAPISRPWDFDDGYHFRNICNPVCNNQPQSFRQNCNKKTYSWNSTEVEKNFSQNRHPYVPNRIRTPLGTSGGFARLYAPPHETSAKSSLPWSTILRMSVLPSRSLSSDPCPEVKLIGKYLADDDVPGSSIEKKTPTFPGWWRNKYIPKENDSQNEVNCQSKTENFSRKKPDESSDHKINSCKLEKMLGTNASNSWSGSHNFLGGWRKRETIPLAFHSTGPVSTFGRWSVNARKICSTSLNNVQEIDRKNSDTVCANTFSRSITPPLMTKSNSFVPDLSASQVGIFPTTGKVATIFDEWKTSRASCSSAMDSCLKGEEERLKKIGLILG